MSCLQCFGLPASSADYRLVACHCRALRWYHFVSSHREGRFRGCSTRLPLCSACLIYYLVQSRSGFRRTCSCEVGIGAATHRVHLGHQSFRNRVAHAFIESSVLTSIFAVSALLVRLLRAFVDNLRSLMVARGSHSICE